MPLTITADRDNFSTRTMKITGFTEQELHELNSMDYRDMKETLLNIIDDRNKNTATCWHNGYGIYCAWIRDDAAYVEIGKSCD